MSTIPILTGEFVDLRPLDVADAALTLAWRQADRAKLLNRGADALADQERWIASRPKSECNFIIQLKPGQPVGMLSLVGIDQTNKHAESGRFLIGEEEAVRGIPAAVNAMLLLYRYAFGTLGLHRIHGTVASDNTMMVRWQKYLGMKEEGRLRDHYFIDGKFQDAICLGILSDEFQTVCEPRMNVLLAAGRRKG